ncbi:MAG: phosphoribosylamine--glycine ligase [Dialister sp.]|nr:phosphoribosylamine--glycine ligase [Dialister sp.]
MRVLVIGSGGREHALLWKLAQSPSVADLSVAPGNDGMSDVAHIIPIKSKEDILDYVRLMKIDLTVAGPETVLTDGLADEFEKQGYPFFGPGAEAARIEGSKGFAKVFMEKYHIPTAAYKAFANKREAVAYIEQAPSLPLVIKADGLAAGKGVIIAQTKEEAKSAVMDMLDGHAFGAAGKSVVIEEYMEGEEASVLCFCDGTRIVPMISSQDHKRIGDGDTGPNTGGMGAYAPAPVMTEELSQVVYDTILLPTIRGMKKEGHPFKGCLYAGLMITKDGPKVVEFNCRFGDPETEAVLPLLDGDLAKIMLDCAKGRLKKEDVTWKKAYAVDVVLAAEGYPGPHSGGEEIKGLEEAKKAGCHLFHAGTKKVKGKPVVNGGRVLNVVAVAPTLKEAKEKAYEGVSKIRWRGMQYRHDIADKGLKHLHKK